MDREREREKENKQEFQRERRCGENLLRKNLYFYDDCLRYLC